MKLVHYSHLPFELDRSRKYMQGFRPKPSGLWLSVEPGHPTWKDWCLQRDFALECLRYSAEIILEPSAHILTIDTVEKLDEFSDEYLKSMEMPKDFYIDWRAVKDAYDGIIIAPYHWARRLELTWYYTWDCASGVIWNLSAIKEAK
jgi:hypothetical protein